MCFRKRKMKNNKRGMFTVVTTLIIILLTIVAFGIIWVVVRNVLDEGKEEIDLSKITVDLEISKVIVEEGNLTIGVKREKGEGNLIGINFIFSDGDNSIVLKRETNINEFEMKSFDFVLENLEIGDIRSIEIVPILELELGKKSIPSEPIDKIIYEEGELSFRELEEEQELLYWNITSEQYCTFVNEIVLYNTSSLILNLINSDFEIVSRENTFIYPSIITYENKKGTPEDLLRLILTILLFNQWNGVYFVYEENSNLEAIVPFRDLEIHESRYFYFENGIFKIASAGESFEDILSSEELRQNILIDRYGIIFEGDISTPYNLTKSGIQEWYLR